MRRQKGMADGTIVGLDLGSSTVRVAVAQPLPGEDGKPRLHIIGAVALPSAGVHKGTISSMEEAVSSISKILERAERMTGRPRTVVTVALMLGIVGALAAVVLVHGAGRDRP